MAGAIGGCLQTPKTFLGVIVKSALRTVYEPKRVPLHRSDQGSQMRHIPQARRDTHANLVETLYVLNAECSNLTRIA